MHPMSEGKSESHTGWIMRRQDKRTRGWDWKEMIASSFKKTSLDNRRKGGVEVEHGINEITVAVIPDSNGSWTREDKGKTMKYQV